MPPTRSAPPRAFLLSLVALSGAASLTYELLWIRALGRHFGTTTPAITTVVATFMAGLGVGYLWFGRRADQSLRPFQLYQRLELGIAVTGLAVSLFLLRGGSWLDALARVCASAGPLSLVCTALVLALLMLPPTIAMGGTVPVLASALARLGQRGREAQPTPTLVPEGEPGRALALLYASNTLGAIAGALCPDFVLIPRFGMTLTACVAAAANLIIALCVQRFAGMVIALETSHAEDPAAATLQTGVTRPSPERVAALTLSACGGFCALGLEVLWSRTLQHWAAALVTSFAVLLAVYLFALALGAFVSERWAARVPQPLTAACVLTGLTALSASLPLWAAPRWRDLARAVWPRPDGVRRVGLAHEAVDALLHAGFLELFACLAMGATFPFIAAAWLANGQAGARSGQLFIVNTFAGVLGSVVVGFWWLPQLGEQASYLALALVLASVALLCAFMVRARVAAISGALCLAGVLALTLLLPDSQLFQAHFRSGGHVFAIEQGATTTAAVAARFLYGELYYLELLTPGTSMSSTRGDARRYMSVMAHAAMFSAPQPERALLICYGVGNTAHSLLAHPGLKRLDVVDTSQEVLALSHHFAAARGNDPLRDPRTHVFVADGRHHLITHEARYDVITAEPPPPNHAGVSNLYSREFYQLARERLAANGVITQWLPVFQLSDDDVRAMIAAFVAELPYSALLYGYEQQLVLIGSKQPLHMHPVADEALTRELQNSYIRDADELLGSVILSDAELRRLVQGVEPLGDDRPSLQYPREDVRVGTYFTSLISSEAPGALQLSASAERAAASTQRALRSLPLRDLSPPEARELALGPVLTPALREIPHDEGLWELLAVDIDRARLAERALSRPGAAELLRAKPEAQLSAAERARYLVLQDAAWMLARRAFYAGDYARSLELLALLRPEPDDTARHWLFVAGCLRALKRHEASTHAFTSAAAASGDPSFRAECANLAAHASQPFEPNHGPWIYER